MGPDQASYQGKKRHDKNLAKYKEAMAKKTASETAKASRPNTVDAAGRETFVKPGHEGWKIDVGPAERKTPSISTTTVSPGQVPTGPGKVTWGVGKAGISTVIDLGNKPSTKAIRAAHATLRGTKTTPTIKTPTTTKVTVPTSRPAANINAPAGSPKDQGFSIPKASLTTGQKVGIATAAVASIVALTQASSSKGAKPSKTTVKRNKSPQVEAARNRLPIETEKFITAEPVKIYPRPPRNVGHQNVKSAFEAIERANARAANKTKFQTPKIEAPTTTTPTEVPKPKAVVYPTATGDSKQEAKREIAASKAAIGKTPTAPATPATPTVKAPETPAAPKVTTPTETPKPKVIPSGILADGTKSKAVEYKAPTIQDVASMSTSQRNDLVKQTSSRIKELEKQIKAETKAKSMTEGSEGYQSKTLAEQLRSLDVAAKTKGTGMFFDMSEEAQEARGREAVLKGTKGIRDSETSIHRRELRERRELQDRRDALADKAVAKEQRVSGRRLGDALDMFGATQEEVAEVGRTKDALKQSKAAQTSFIESAKSANDPEVNRILNELAAKETPADIEASNLQKQANEILKKAGSEDLVIPDLLEADTRTMRPEEIDLSRKAQVLKEARKQSEIAQNYLEKTTPASESKAKNRAKAEAYLAKRAQTAVDIKPQTKVIPEVSASALKSENISRLAKTGKNVVKAVTKPKNLVRGGIGLGAATGAFIIPDVASAYMDTSGGERARIKAAGGKALEAGMATGAGMGIFSAALHGASKLFPAAAPALGTAAGVLGTAAVGSAAGQFAGNIYHRVKAAQQKNARDEAYAKEKYGTVEAATRTRKGQRADGSQLTLSDVDRIMKQWEKDKK